MSWIQRWLKYSRHQTTAEDTIMNAASVWREFSTIELAYKQDSIFTLTLPRWWERAKNLPHFRHKDWRLKRVLERDMLKSPGGDDGVSDEEDSGNLDFNRGGESDCQHPSMWGRCFRSLPLLVWHYWDHVPTFCSSAGSRNIYLIMYQIFHFHMYMCVMSYVYIYIYTHIYMHIYMHTYIYIYIHTHT